jgi:hypothetical protein
VTESVTAGLTAVVAIIERDYVVTPTSVPEDVNEIQDKDGDSYFRLADGRWIGVGNSEGLWSLETIQNSHGPVTW